MRWQAASGGENRVCLGGGFSRSGDRPHRDRAGATHVDARAGSHSDAGSIPAASTIFPFKINYLDCPKMSRSHIGATSGLPNAGPEGLHEGLVRELGVHLR